MQSEGADSFSDSATDAPEVTAHQTPTGDLLLDEEGTAGWLSTDRPVEARQ